MDITSVASTSVPIGAGQGAPSSVSVASPVSVSSQPNAALVANATVSPAVPSPAQITQAVKQINDAFTQGGQNVYATFEFDKAVGMEVIKFTDSNTNQVISQVPSKAALAIAQSLQNSQGSGSGQLINTQA
jgi:flagellar protein FlaG